MKQDVTIWFSIIEYWNNWETQFLYICFPIETKPTSLLHDLQDFHCFQLHVSVSPSPSLILTRVGISLGPNQTSKYRNMAHQKLANRRLQFMAANPLILPTLRTNTETRVRLDPADWHFLSINEPKRTYTQGRTYLKTTSQKIHIKEKNRHQGECESAFEGSNYK